MLNDSEHMQAVLLLYLAGELPADERTDLEERLAHHHSLRQSLEELRSLNDGLTLMLQESDALAIPAAARESRRGTAVRQISRAMVRRQLQENASESFAPLQIKRWWLRTWALPIAAAVAMVGLGVFYLAGNISSPLPSSDPDSSLSLNIDHDVTDGDRSVLAISTGAEDVSSMFEGQAD